MPQIDFSVRLFSSKLIRFRLDHDTPILAFKERLEIEQNLPEFHEVLLYVGEIELVGGNISDVVLLEGIEVQAVASASIEKALNVFRNIYVELRSSGYWQNLPDVYRPRGEIDQTRAKAARAASFLLLQFEDQVHGGVCEVILDFFAEWRQEHARLASFSPLWQLFEDVVILGCRLLGKYGNAIAADGLHELINVLLWHDLYHDTNPMAVAAIDAEDKLKTQQGIQ
jgi:hypothetical protein